MRWLKAACGVEAEPVSTRGGDRFVDELKRAADRCGRFRVVDADTPRQSIRARSGSARFAHIDEAALDTFGAQILHHAVGDETLCDPVERQGHAAPTENDPVGVEGDMAEADPLQVAATARFGRAG